MPPPRRPSPYSNIPSPTADPRQVESWALVEVAMRLKATQREPMDEAILLHAVRLNWRLWTIFQASLLDVDCALGIDLRNNLLSLSNFIDKHTADIIASPTPSKLDVLIHINRELAGGLMTSLHASTPKPVEATVPQSGTMPLNVRT